jgi:uncharacterized protein DUF4328
VSDISARYHWREPGQMGRVLQVLLVLSGILSLTGAIAAALVLDDRNLVYRVPAGGGTSVSVTLGPSPTFRWFPLLWIPSLLSQVTIVVWLVWQHGATANLWARRLADLRTTPGWAVGWWFVPFAWYVMPFLAMRELDRRSSPGDAPRRMSPLVAWWWCAWVGGQLVSLVGLFGFAFPSLQGSFDAIPRGATSIDLGPFVRAFLPWAVVAGLGQALAGVFGSQVVGRIDRGQRAMAAASVPPRPDR